MSDCKLTVEAYVASILPINLKTVILTWSWFIYCKSAGTCTSPKWCVGSGRIKDLLLEYDLESSLNPNLSDLDRQSLRDCAKRKINDWEDHEKVWEKCAYKVLGTGWRNKLWDYPLQHPKPPPDPDLSDARCDCISLDMHVDRSTQEEFIRRNSLNEQRSVIFKREISRGRM